jgi:hypothetical protein
MRNENISDVDYERFSIFGYPISPIAQLTAITPRQDSALRPYSNVSPMFNLGNAQARLMPHRFGFLSPNIPPTVSQQQAMGEADFPQLATNEFRMTYDNEESGPLLAHASFSRFNNFPPLIPAVNEPKSTSIRINSKLMFNPLSSADFLNKNGIVLQENLFIKELELRNQQVSFQLRKLNYFCNDRIAERKLEQSLKPLDSPMSEGSKLQGAKSSKRKGVIKKLPRAVPLEKRRRRNIHCNCKNTKCIKLYCECFRNKILCGNQCKCTCCNNNYEHLEQRTHSMNEILRKNPEAFAGAIEKPSMVARKMSTAVDDVIPPTYALSSCHCKKSQCLKKYCECYSAGIGCSEFCKCRNCSNNTTGETPDPRGRTAPQVHSLAFIRSSTMDDL